MKHALRFDSVPRELLDDLEFILKVRAEESIAII